MDPPPAPNGVLEIDVGGVLYRTTADTLRRGSAFFDSLLSGRMPSTKDSQGRYFIDRNGECFRYILEYLRTGELFVPRADDVLRLQVLTEARFYLVDGLVSAIESSIASEMNPPEPPPDVLLHNGYYVLDDGPTDANTIAYYFSPDDLKLTEARGANAKEMLMLMRKLAGRSLPEIWRDSREVSESYAAFYSACIRRGRYEIDGVAVTLRTAMHSIDHYGVLYDSRTLMVARSSDQTFHLWRKFSFVPFDSVDPAAATAAAKVAAIAGTTGVGGGGPANA